MNDLAQQIEYYVRLPYRVTIERDECDGAVCYIARHPELRGCMAQGKTPDEAVADLDDALYDYITALLEEGIPIPLPIVRQIHAHKAVTSTKRWPSFSIGRTILLSQVG
ncbi:MAG: type II toxin-antitoxin system HicB family antitoxin [Herpetosiphonaceae bacterium]|nr:type II toxin-antitoxin system HicB family antitoxin [Herpetosiphonaceae bacterium]